MSVLKKIAFYQDSRDEVPNLAGLEKVNGCYCAVSPSALSFLKRQKPAHMNVAMHDLHGTQAAEMQSEGIIIRTARDAAELTKELTGRGVRKLILHERNLAPEFWQPSNGIAGAVLKCFADSSIALALVGTFDRRKAASLTTLIKEKSLGDLVTLSDSVEAAIALLSGAARQ